MADDLHTAKCERVLRIARAALLEAEEYFDDRADAELGQCGTLPNEEMVQLIEVRAALREVTAALGIGLVPEPRCTECGAVKTDAPVRCVHFSEPDRCPLETVVVDA